MDDAPTPCPFCDRIPNKEGLIAVNAAAVTFEDAFPISPGHTLVVPRRHEPDFFALDVGEQRAIWEMVGVVRGMLAKSHSPDGFNVGLNAGTAAGQTVFHTHVHVIPRYVGDVDDPRGGVRWVVPDRARYWER